MDGVDGVPQKEKVAEGEVSGKPAEEDKMREAAAASATEASEELTETEEEVEEEKKRATG